MAYHVSKQLQQDIQETLKKLLAYYEEHRHFLKEYFLVLKLTEILTEEKIKDAALKNLPARLSARPEFKKILQEIKAPHPITEDKIETIKMSLAEKSTKLARQLFQVQTSFGSKILEKYAKERIKWEEDAKEAKSFTAMHLDFLNKEAERQETQALQDARGPAKAFKQLSRFKKRFGAESRAYHAAQNQVAQTREFKQKVELLSKKQPTIVLFELPLRKEIQPHINELKKLIRKQLFAETVLARYKKVLGSRITIDYDIFRNALKKINSFEKNYPTEGKTIEKLVSEVTLQLSSYQDNQRRKLELIKVKSKGQEKNFYDVFQKRLQSQRELLKKKKSAIRKTLDINAKLPLKEQTKNLCDLLLALEKSGAPEVVRKRYHIQKEKLDHLLMEMHFPKAQAKERCEKVRRKILKNFYGIYGNKASFSDEFTEAQQMWLTVKIKIEKNAAIPRSKVSKKPPTSLMFKKPKTKILQEEKRGLLKPAKTK